MALGKSFPMKGKSKELLHGCDEKKSQTTGCYSVVWVKTFHFRVHSEPRHLQMCSTLAFNLKSENCVCIWLRATWWADRTGERADRDCVIQCWTVLWWNSELHGAWRVHGNFAVTELGYSGAWNHGMCWEKSYVNVRIYLKYSFGRMIRWTSGGSVLQLL